MNTVVRRTITAVAGTAAAMAVTTTAVTANPNPEQPPGNAQNRPAEPNPDRLIAIGLTTDQRLVRFAVVRPDRTGDIGTVTGLQGDRILVGIDYRVQDGLLYGLGDAGGVYTLTTANAAATKVSQLTVPLSGTAFGIDFDPVADRLRVVSDTGQNLRHDVRPGGVTVADSTLSYPPSTTPATGITAAAYTNNDADPLTGTTLFHLDTTLNQIALQSPANSGQLAGTGKPGADVGPSAGLDIHSTIRNGVTVRNDGFGPVLVGGSYQLYNGDLLTGDGRNLGAFPADTQVCDLALPLNQL